MVKLLTCAQGHFWEVDDAESNGALIGPPLCPSCGCAAETVPDLDLAPSDPSVSTPVANAVTPVADAPGSPPPPLVLRDAQGRPFVAGYEILADLGRSPRGVLLYRAKQVLVNRVVILKVVFAKDDPGQRAWGCLRGEASALGKLSHPNIVQIFEVGERERQLFYNAVEFVDGPTLADRVKKKPLTPRQAAQVVEIVARAVHAAHEKGLLHRSLKPASIFFAGQAETPIEQSTLKIAGFGQAARPIEGDINDLDLQGTLPYYLSPEQAWGRTKDFGPATDVYALGAILFELLAGRQPFQADDWPTFVDKIQGKEAPWPSDFQKRVPKELDVICRKCLVKSPRRRYASALELADDLRLYLDGYPVKARPTSQSARFAKWVKRRPLGCAFILLVFFALVTPLVVYLIGEGKADSAALEGVRVRDASAKHEISNLQTRLQDAQASERAATYFRWIALAEKAAADKSPALKAMLEDCPTEFRHWEWYYLRDVAQQKQGQPFTSLRTGNKPILSFSSGNAFGWSVAAGTAVEGDDKNAALYVWSPLTNSEMLPTKQYDGPVEAIAYNAGGNALAVAVANTAPGRDKGSHIIVRTLPGGAVRNTIDVPDARVTNLVYSPDQQHLTVSRNDGKTVLHRVTDGMQAMTLGINFNPPNMRDLNRVRVAYNGDGSRVAGCSSVSREVQVMDGMGRVQMPDIFPGSNSVCLAYNTQNYLAVGGSDGVVTLFDADLHVSHTMRGHVGSVNALAFSRDGKRLATAGTDKTVKVWEVATGLEILTLKDMLATPVGLAFSPDNQQLAVAVGNEVRFYGNVRR
jgi:hypothetical protein